MQRMRVGIAVAAAACVLGTLLPVGVDSAAVAQDAAGDIGRSAECQPAASRTRESCEPTKAVFSTQGEISFSVELPPITAAHCAVTIEIAYTQRDTVASVDGTLHNTDCAASAGEYKVLVVTRGEDGKLTTLEFLESWQRNDAEPLPFNGHYPIGANVDLIRVRAQSTRCTCAAAPEG